MSDPRNQDGQSEEATEQLTDPATTDPDTADGGPGSHNEGGTGGETNDPASGGISQEASEDSEG